MDELLCLQIKLLDWGLLRKFKSKEVPVALLIGLTMSAVDRSKLRNFAFSWSE